MMPLTNGRYVDGPCSRNMFSFGLDTVKTPIILIMSLPVAAAVIYSILNEV